MKLAKVRISGDTAVIGEVLLALADAARAGHFEIPEQSALYPNRRDPGYRVYVTLAFPGDPESSSAGRRTTAKQSAAPLPPIPAKETQARRHLP